MMTHFGPYLATLFLYVVLLGAAGKSGAYILAFLFLLSLPAVALVLFLGLLLSSDRLKWLMRCGTTVCMGLLTFLAAPVGVGR